MRISIGSDHRGIEQRAWVAATVAARGDEVTDEGTFSTDSCDYPDIAAAVGRRVANGQCERGILICGTGIGVAIAANKIYGIRAAVVHDLHTSEMSRRHNNANVLCLPGDSMAREQQAEIVNVWLETGFDGGRHERRVKKITELEASENRARSHQDA